MARLRQLCKRSEPPLARSQVPEIRRAKLAKLAKDGVKRSPDPQWSKLMLVESAHRWPRPRVLVRPRPGAGHGRGDDPSANGPEAGADRRHAQATAAVVRDQ